jgi:ornithine cyclodeaminase/alanine dehydrogenase-like protein (mu-crystallin family)
MLVVSRAEVRELLDLDALVDALAEAMAEVSAGRVSMPTRVAAFVPDQDGLLAAMPAHLPSAHALTTKLVSLFPRNEGTATPTHQAVIAVFDSSTGTPLALLDGAEITAARTAGGSALSARLLAREDASTLAILGTGVQAHAHARALPRIRAIREIRIAGRDRGRSERVAAELAEELGIPVRAAGSYAAAADGADIVCATTHTVEPVVRRECLADGVHVTSVGYNPAGRELDDATVADSFVSVESREAVLAPPPGGSRDLIDPVAAGIVGEDDIHEVGEIVLGRSPGRTSPSQITLYKSVGIAVQDAAAAALVLAAARERGAGAEVPL